MNLSFKHTEEDIQWYVDLYYSLNERLILFFGTAIAIECVCFIKVEISSWWLWVVKKMQSLFDIQRKDSAVTPAQCTRPVPTLPAPPGRRRGVWEWDPCAVLEWTIEKSSALHVDRFGTIFCTMQWYGRRPSNAFTTYRSALVTKGQSIGVAGSLVVRALDHYPKGSEIKSPSWQGKSVILPLNKAVNPLFLGCHCK
jgi:hypothetical protein